MKKLRHYGVHAKTGNVMRWNRKNCMKHFKYGDDDWYDNYTVVLAYSATEAKRKVGDRNERY